MLQNFTEQEAAAIHSPYTAKDKRAQLQLLRSFALQAQAAVTLKEVASMRERVLHFRASLGPDDNTYDIIVDARIDSLGLDLLTYCNQRLNNQPEYAKQYLKELLALRDKK